jgi:hypothetical protein
MSSFRSVDISFWKDAFVLDLPPEDKFFYLYLLTNPHLDTCGCYELSLKTIEHETGYPRDTVINLIQQFEKYGKICYDMQTREILLMNWERHNKGYFKQGNNVLRHIVQSVAQNKV